MRHLVMINCPISFAFFILPWRRTSTLSYDHTFWEKLRREDVKELQQSPFLEVYRVYFCPFSRSNNEILTDN